MAMSSGPSMTLLDHVRTLVEAERGLTEAIENSLPLLSHNINSSQSHGEQTPHNSSVLSSLSDPPLLPTPRNTEEVKTVLAVARAYSLRTSAPSGWNPTLPVIGFATPNPLPHQLRGGALGAMQLRMVREERSRKSKEAAERRELERRKKIEEEERRRRRKEEEEMAMDLDGAKRKREEGRDSEADPRKWEMVERRRRQMEQAAANGNLNRQSAAEIKAKKEAANMNLSDSSSSEDDDDSDDSSESD